MKLLFYIQKEKNANMLQTVLACEGFRFDETVAIREPDQLRLVLKRGDSYLVVADNGFDEVEKFLASSRDREVNMRMIFLDVDTDLRRYMRLGVYDCLPTGAGPEDLAESMTQLVEVLNNRDRVYWTLAAFRQQRAAITASIMRGFLQHSPNQRDFVEMQQLGLVPRMEKPGWLALLHITNREENAEWDRTLIAVSISNILAELMQPMNELHTIASVQHDIFAITLQKREGKEAPVEMVEERLNLMRTVIQQYFGWEMSLYLDGPMQISQAPDRWDGLLKYKQKNVTMRPGIFRVWETKDELSSLQLPAIRNLLSFLLEGQVEIVEQECEKMLQELTDVRRMNDRLLQAFYQEYIQIVYSAMWHYGWEAKKLFQTSEEIEIMINAVKSVNQMKKLLHYVTEYFREKLPETTPKTAVELVCDYIELHYKDQITREELAKYTHLNSDYLSRRFKRELGLTITEYVTKKRMEAAQVMLHNSKMHISEIAESVGYNNYAYFTAIYHKTYGITPRQERERGKKP